MFRDTSPRNVRFIYGFSWDEHAEFESLSRNRVSNISFTISSIGEILILVVMVGILEGLKAGDSTANNTKAFSVLIAFSGALWCELISWVRV